MALPTDFSVLEGFNRERTLSHLAAIVESSGDAVISKTLEGVILTWNPGAERLYGYSASEAIGQPMTLLLPEDRSGEEVEILQRISLGERVEHFETVRRHKSGELIDVSLSISPIRNQRGRIVGASHVARNVSDRRRLDTQAALLAAIVQSSDDAILSKTPDGVILTWNRGAERLYGYPADEVIGQSITLLLPPERLAEENEILDQIRRGCQVQHFETVRRKKDGSPIEVSLTISPIFDSQGQIVGASHVARDITQRRRLEHRLEQLAAIVESAEDAILSKTLEGVILTWNAGAERVYGYPAAEAIGAPMTMLLPEGLPNEENEILRRIRRGERVEHFETIRRRKNGDLIDVSLTISPIRDKDGHIVAASHVARDVTERKRLEEQLLQTQKLESLGVLAGGIAHDFNNLLTGILGNTSLALDSLPPHHPVRVMLRDVMGASERASHLTRQLLAYAGKGRFVVEPVNLSRLVHEITGLIQTSISKNVQLRLELEPHLPMIEADASQIQQIIMNLVINGSEAVPSNVGGTVTVTTKMERIDKSRAAAGFGSAGDLEPGLYAALEVRDTGCGMDEITLQRIFDPFFTTKFLGRGLGLAAVQGIVQGHKGALRVESEPGKGTTFQVLFPASGAPELAEVPSLPARDDLILVVDDEEIVRRTAKAMLERNGYGVVVAENGKVAAELFEVLADKISAVILDVTMPVADGEETFRRLKSLRPDIKIILSSGYNEAETVCRFPENVLAGFLQKPYSSTTLLEQVAAVVGRRASAKR